MDPHPYLVALLVIVSIAALFPYPLVFVFLSVYAVILLCNPPVTIEEHLEQIKKNK